MSRILACLTLGLAIGLAVPSGAGAQTTFTACRVPDVGAIYMIGVAGAPTECLDASHVEFSWTEGGELATGSVTSEVILDGTIATSDIAAGAVTSAQIAPNAVGTSEIAGGAVGDSELGLVVTVTPSAGLTTQSHSHVANCPSGKVPIAGGYALTSSGGPNNSSSFTTTRNGPSGNGWQVVGYWPSLQSGGWSWNVYVICIASS